MHGMMSIIKLAARTGTILAGMAVLAPAISPARASKDAAEKAPTVEDVEKALEFTPDSDFGRAMSDVDDTGTWRGTALFMLMERAGALPALDALEIKRLDRPAHRSLMKTPARWRLIRGPARWRCPPMRMTVTVHRVMKMNGLSMEAPPALWPVDKPIWRMECTDASVAHLRGPITIWSTVEPKGLGEPSEPTDEDEDTYEQGELIYKRKPQIEVVCVFHKLYEAKQMKGRKGKERLYPLVVAWQAGEARAAGRSTGFDQKYLIAGLAICAVALAYYLIRKHTRRLSKPGPAIKYRPKRDEIDAAGGDDQADAQDDDQSVDPQLAAAAAEYEKERQDRDADGKG